MVIMISAVQLLPLRSIHIRCKLSSSCGKVDLNILLLSNVNFRWRLARPEMARFNWWNKGRGWGWGVEGPAAIRPPARPPSARPPSNNKRANKKKLRICKCCVVGSLLNHPVCLVFVNQRRITFVDTSDLIRYPDYGLYSLSSPWSCYCDCFRYWFLLLVLLIDEGVNIRVDLVSTLDRSFAMCRVVGPSSWNWLPVSKDHGRGVVW